MCRKATGTQGGGVKSAGGTLPGRQRAAGACTTHHCLIERICIPSAARPGAWVPEWRRIGLCGAPRDGGVTVVSGARATRACARPPQLAGPSTSARFRCPLKMRPLHTPQQPHRTGQGLPTRRPGASGPCPTPGLAGRLPPRPLGPPETCRGRNRPRCGPSARRRCRSTQLRR